LGPAWPSFVHFLGGSPLNTLNLDGCKMHKNDVELIATSIFENPVSETQLRVLNLSNNAILKDGAKALAAALEGNTTIEVLDLSQCKLGVSGTSTITKALLNNKTLKSLNLYNNNADVDGARAIRDLLRVNSTLEFLDVGYNRLREKGVNAITDGISENSTSGLRHLGLRYNFINDDGIKYLFNNLVLNKESKSKLDHIYMMQNFINEHCIIGLQEKVKASQLSLFVDSFAKLNNLSQSKLDNSIWVSTLTLANCINPEKVWKFFE